MDHTLPEPPSRFAAAIAASLGAGSIFVLAILVMLGWMFAIGGESDNSETDALKLLDHAEVQLMLGDVLDAERWTDQADALAPTSPRMQARIELLRRRAANARANLLRVPGVATGPEVVPTAVVPAEQLSERR